MKRQLILFVERHTRLLRGVANQWFPDWALGPFSWFHSLLLASNLENDCPPPGGYFKSGEWNDPEPRRNFNVNPYGTKYANGDDKSDAAWQAALSIMNRFDAEARS